MTRSRTLAVLAGIAVLASAAVCARLGFWQLARLEEKRALNATRRALLAEPPIEWPAAGLEPSRLEGRRVVVRGTYDDSRQILIRGRAHEGEPGVVVVTPLLTGDTLAVLIERGWLPAEDGLTARPQDFPEPGPVEVLGVARRLESGSGNPAPRLLPGDGPRLHSAARLDRDSLGQLFPYPLAGFVVHQLRGAGVPDHPIRTPEPPYDEGLHLGYAVQWFAFAVILLAGSMLFAWTRRSRGSARTAPPLA